MRYCHYFSRYSSRAKTAYFLIILVVGQLLLPIPATALTSGPTQPELQSFQPVGTTDMVDLFSGDFNYNIPLFELPGPNGGYPVNLFYNSVTNADDEASSVGLGWNLGIGAINRQMRGLPDDFNGDQITQRRDMKDDWTLGISLGFSAEAVGFPISPALDYSLMYNSYKGFGYSYDVKLRMQMGNGDGLSVTPEFGFGYNSFEGASSNIGLTMSNKSGDITNSLSFGVGLSTRGPSSFSFSASSSVTRNGKAIDKDGKITYRKHSSSASGGFDLSFAQPVFTPQVSMETSSANVSLNIQLGGTIQGFELAGRVGGFFRNRWLKKKNQSVQQKAYGAMYLQNADEEEKALLDFNRTNDAAIRFEQPNLAIPSFTTDVLSVTGQGVGGTYQLYRSDIPFFRDPKAVSEGGGGSLGFDFGPSISPQFGLDFSFNWSRSENVNNIKRLGNIGAHNQSLNSAFEPYYYKVAGELTAENTTNDDYLGGNKMVRLELTGQRKLQFGDELLTETGQPLSDVEGRSERKPRTTSIQPITNRDLLDSLLPDMPLPILPEYLVTFYNKTNQPNNVTTYKNETKDTLQRTRNDKVAGYTTLSTNGTRWNFALPVQNKTQKEVTFSVPRPSDDCVKTVDITYTGDSIHYKVPNTEKYLDISTMPEYAHAYLLTSVMGTDYIDTDPTDGEPNEKDKGYWVRMEYLRTSNNYKWRAPYFGATYNGGLANKNEDDKGMFTYGEREQYYPARLVSKTHVAEFYYSKRNDSRGAYNWLQNSGAYGEYCYKVDSIAIFSISEMELADAESRNPIAMKVVHFEYDYSLCGSTLNSSSGKLTLKKVYFTYENNTRGALNPYQFEYNGNNDEYQEMAFDRWGAYKPAEADACENMYNPYVNQMEADSVQAALVETWHLTDIYLPSGAHMHIDVGRDHYSHEQNKIAGQMFKISGVKKAGSVGNSLSTAPNLSASNRTIFFDLETPISQSLSSQERQVLIDNYFTDLYETPQGKQLFFQINTDIFNRNNPKYYQDINGYAFIESYGLDASTTSGGNYHKGYIVLKEYQGLNLKNGDNFHPFALMAWQFAKLNLTDVMYGQPPGNNVVIENNPSDNQIESTAAEFVAMIGELGNIFKSYYRFCSNNGFANKLNLDKCFIRLNTPDRKMYGDGVRINKITLHDSWDEEETPVYGTVYEYEEPEIINGEPTGRMISSGTATNTPNVGKQESSLRYAKYYDFMNDLMRRQTERHFTEYPLNEGYYPGASIGYRRVVVKSLATDYAIKRLNGEDTPSELPSNLPDGFATSGVVVHEFYTAKDFPVIVRETPVDAHRNDIRYIPFGPFGSYRSDRYTGSQGYSIELNNMHGKPRKVSNYAQDKWGAVEAQPISFVEYEYLSHEEVYTEGGVSRKRKVLDNIVDVVVSDLDPNDATKAEIIEGLEMGVEREFFVDIRENHNVSGSAGGAFNTDIFYFGLFAIPVPTGFPTIHSSIDVVRTAVTNKVIRRSAIQSKTIAYDGQARVETENLLYDRYTGQPLLTSVNNAYGDKIYNYSVPAHFAYAKTKPAYSNWGMRLNANIDTLDCSGYHPMTINHTSPDSVAMHLQEGDEFIIKKWSTNSAFTQKTRATLINKIWDGSSTKLFLAVDDFFAGAGDYEMFLVRSGNRNQLSASVGAIAALSNPTINRHVDSCTQTFYSIDFTPVADTQKSLTPSFLAYLRFINTFLLHKEEITHTMDSLGYYPFVGDVEEVNEAYSDWANTDLITSNSCCENLNENSFFGISMDSSLTLSGDGLFLLTTDSVNCINNIFPFLNIDNYALLSNPNITYTGASLDSLLQTLNYQNIVSIELYDVPPPAYAFWRFIITVDRNGYFEQYLMHSSAGGCTRNYIEIHIGERYIASPDTIMFSPNFPYRTIDNVLNISANTYSDAWDMGMANNCSVSMDIGENVFRTGKRGIYRPLGTWSYVDERKQTSPNVNLRTDGTFDDVPLFDWKNAYMTKCDAFSGWKNTETVTRYANNGDAVESRNIIGQYGSALYGYNGSLPIAVAQNARYCEIGFEGFEEHAATSNVCNLTSFESGNINFIPRACIPPVVQTYDMVTPVYGNSTGVAVNLPYSAALVTPDKAVANITNLNGETVTFETGISQVSEYTDGSNSYAYFTFDRDLDCLLSDQIQTDISKIRGMTYNGTLTLYYNQSGNTCWSNFALVDTVSHTGSKSLRIPTALSLPQYQLKLEVGKQYVFSAWVKLDGVESHTYLNKAVASINFTSSVYPSGAIIDGWQRMEGIFTATVPNPYLSFIRLSGTAMYIDDIRIFPMHGNVQTYIYDPVNYKPTEILDNNNYFTRYLYDSQGTVIAVQKETQEGLKTIKETGSHTKNTQ